VGEFSGTSPRGNVYDHEPTFFIDDTDDRPSTSITGPAGPLDGWLWGRADTTDLTIEGDAGLADLLRSVAADSTG
jgi:hypothetical protein